MLCSILAAKDIKGSCYAQHKLLVTDNVFKMLHTQTMTREKERERELAHAKELKKGFWRIHQAENHNVINSHSLMA